MKLDLFIVAVVNCLAILLIGNSGTVAAASTSSDDSKPKVALLIIDVQDCFLPNGSLAVKDGEQVIPVINRIRQEEGSLFSTVVLSQDWHCAEHVSFASQHPLAQPYSELNLTYNAQGQLCYGTNVPEDYPHAIHCTESSVTVEQTLWPDHCIQNASGPTSAGFSPLLTQKLSDIIVRKGDTCEVDSYSAFFDNGGFRQTELNELLKARGIDIVVVTGLALDFCVYYTSKDAFDLGYKVLTVTDASRGVAPDSTEAAVQDMREHGVELIQSAQLGNRLRQLISVAVPLCGPSIASLLLLATVVVTSVSCLVGGN